eukprot:PhM_4_TR15342/c0_g1_i1/m.76952
MSAPTKPVRSRPTAPVPPHQSKSQTAHDTKTSSKVGSAAMKPSRTWIQFLTATRSALPTILCLAVVAVSVVHLFASQSHQATPAPLDKHHEAFLQRLEKIKQNHPRNLCAKHMSRELFMSYPA